MKRICVFCGSSTGSRAIYREAAHSLGRALHKRGIGLVYGGGNVGLMGIVADAVMEGGGNVVGVIPEALVKRELAHRTVTELIVVRSMHERKAKMAELSDAFIALPGGYGTFEEFCEIITWAQPWHASKTVCDFECRRVLRLAPRAIRSRGRRRVYLPCEPAARHPGDRSGPASGPYGLLFAASGGEMDRS